MSAGRYAAIILAAGLSSRMPQFKPLLPLDGETITDHVISTFSNCGVDVFLVVGHRQKELRAGIKKHDITIIENKDYRQGMFTSIQAGIRRLQSAHQAFFVMPVDIALVREATIRRLMAAEAEQPEKIFYPVFNAKRGHPALVPSSFISPVLSFHGDGGLKAFLNSHEKLALEVPVADSNILFDIDTPEDYAVLLERFQRGEVPTDEECDIILNTICRVLPDRIRHCYKAAEVAVAIGRALNNAGHQVDTELVRIAAVLHDIAKEKPKHDIAGGQILREMGFGKVGDIVAVHSILSEEFSRFSLETKIVFLADKFVQGEKIVTIEERYSTRSRQFSTMPDAQKRILGHMNVALSVKRELETLIGFPLEKVIF
jgi:molybdenum cofactor cytidylyltransferase